ncbi:ubiquitin carboxyl-terminal hydrolase 14 [Acrocarpospora catenulata]|uniref:ubiquitin carboxyl-terminal hydrolase 14 n=1 Tax=Acrocarpospora catenulata TaxID=2836182 RepID=UPI001BDAA88E|nr:UBP-type zinc finger domain-containing protein [Acrocarpospora catenulata]
MWTCEHLETAGDPPALTSEGCAECLEMGTRWVHLRRCLSCGHIGCCDSSPMRHATAHYKETGHPVISSFEPGETWRWCYADNVMG